MLVPRIAVALVFASLAATTTGCASVNGSRGVDDLWRDTSVAQWKVGQTTEQDVLTALGPPSQLIPLHDETVYYYMLEKAKTRVMILIVYNQARANVRYDRAIFVFDKQGVLTKYSLSPEVDAKKK